MPSVEKKNLVPYSSTYTSLDEDEIFDIIDDCLHTETPVLSFVEMIFFNDVYPQFRTVSVSDLSRHKGFIYQTDSFEAIDSRILSNKLLVDSLYWFNKFRHAFPEKYYQLMEVHSLDSIQGPLVEKSIANFLYSNKTSVNIKLRAN